MKQLILKDIIKKIENKENFAFSRFGDGEWNNIQKRPGKNCDGNIYFHELGDRLKSIVENKQDYYIGSQNLIWNLPSGVDEYKANFYHDSDVFHFASMEGKLQPLFDVLKKTYVVYIGNHFHKPLPFINEFIEIPMSNVWTQYDITLSTIKNTIIDNKHKLYLISAGMCANIFVHDLWNNNKNNSYIDIGSVFDPFVGRNSRKYHKNLTTKSYE